MKSWIIRSMVLLAIPAALAAGDAMMRPTGKARKPVDEASGPSITDQATSPETPEQELKRVAALYHEGTALFVDARPIAQYEESHIPGALHLPFEAFFSGRPEVLDFLPEHLPIVIYCEGGTCDSSHKVEEMLREYGYSDLTLFVAGFPAWKDGGMPVESGPMEIGQ